MLYPSETEYLKLAREYNLIPVYKELLADTETPVSVLQRFRDCENVFLLESMEGGETWGRYSFVGIDPEIFLEVDHSRGDTGKIEKLREVYRNVRTAPVAGLPRFFGGAVGFLAYESMAEFERMPKPKPCADPNALRSRFLKADRMIVFDNVRHTVKIVASTRPSAAQSPAEAYRSARADIERIEGILNRPVPPAPAERVPHAGFKSNMTEDEYCNMVSRAKEYIVAGDIIQAVLSQRFSAESRIPKGLS